MQKPAFFTSGKLNNGALVKEHVSSNSAKHSKKAIKAIFMGRHS